MQVKVFESHDMSSGLRKVRKELGPDALILSTRSVRNGKLGILGKPMLEITAAIDDSKLRSSDASVVRRNADRSFARHAYLRDSSQISKTADTGKTIHPADKGLNVLKAAITATNNHAASLDLSNQQEMRDDIGELKTMVQTLSGEINRLKSSQQFVSPVSVAPSFDLTRQSEDPVSKILEENGILAETANTISQFGRESLSIEDLSNRDTVVDFLQKTISGLLEIAPLEYNTGSTQKRISLLGPTGVGKTTTLAKIAASRSVILPGP